MAVSAGTAALPHAFTTLEAFHVDVKTTAVLLGLANVVLAAILFLAARLGPRYAGTLWWAWGQALIAGGLLLRNLGGPSPLGKFAITVSLTLLATGTCGLYVGLLRFFGRRERKLPLIVMLVAFFAWSAYFSFAANLIHIRGDALYAVDVVVLPLCAWVAWRHGRGAVRASSVLLAAVFSVMAIVYLALLVASIAKGTSTDPLFKANAPLVLAYASTLVGSMLWTFGFVLMVNQKLQGEWAQEAANLATVFATSPDAAALTRMVDGKIIDVNVGFTETSGYSREEALANSSIGLGLWVDSTERERLLSELAKHESCKEFSAQMRRKDGTVMDCLVTAHVLELGGEPFLFSVTRDVSEQRRMEAALLRQATTDDLTGLANRRHFFATAADLQADDSSAKAPLTIVLIDIDGFKAINDTYGHAVGDKAVQSFGRDLREGVGASGVVARLGGDEFGLLLPECDVEQAREIVERIRQTIALRTLDIDGQHVSLTFSAGIAAATGSADVALAQADRALYQAKASGRNRVQFAADVHT